MRPQTLTSLAQEIDQHLSAIRRVLRQPVETEFAHGGLTGPQRSVMQVVVRSGGLSLKECSREVGLSHSTVSGIVDRLVKQGLLERQADKEDRRVSRIVPSKVVRDYVPDTLPALTVHPLAGALRRAKPAERRIIAEGLRLLRRIVQ